MSIRIASPVRLASALSATAITVVEATWPLENIEYGKLAPPSAIRIFAAVRHNPQGSFPAIVGW
jgi:hypothetical protein